ncbi:hypothetical protein RvY_12932-1 [Ramazzottius varieornatus]|uniref:Uncharacterized protein n=1 Tax=Ramazzottius varieornatus TaxID=947166 RepID=A0A1D1VL56_RAMVA|nr:hypothetical protein RvY_12932-1 [Ramazzottius varieornatus]
MVDDGIVLACVINAKSLLSSAIRTQDSGYFSKRSFDGGMKSESLASFRAFRVWMSRGEAGEFPALNQEGEESDKSRAEQRWCEANSLSFIRLREIGLYNGNPTYFLKEFEADPTWQLVMKIILAGAFYSIPTTLFPLPS